MAVYTPELGATPLIHPARIRLDTPSYSLGVSGLETGDTGTWYCRVDGRSNMVTAYNIKVTGEAELMEQLIGGVLIYHKMCWC